MCVCARTIRILSFSRRSIELDEIDTSLKDRFVQEKRSFSSFPHRRSVRSRISRGQRDRRVQLWIHCIQARERESIAAVDSRIFWQLTVQRREKEIRKREKVSLTICRILHSPGCSGHVRLIRNQLSIQLERNRSCHPDLGWRRK